MPFAYYDRLTPARQRVYRKSAEILRIAVPDVAALRHLVAALEIALVAEDRGATERAGQALSAALTEQLATPPIRLRVLLKRPSNAAGELHGLYEPAEGGSPAIISVWMRTAQLRKVVRFRTFLRTLVHELCHHFDYELYRLPETFHTEGFYARESALVRELLGEAPTRQKA